MERDGRYHRGRRRVRANRPRTPGVADEDERESTGAEIVDELETLEASVSSEEERRTAERIRRLGEALYGLEQRAIGGVGERIRTYTTRDVAEAFVGSTLFSLSLVVEGGVFETGEHSTTSLVFGLPVYSSATWSS